jgi:hypothetical protein
MIDESHDLDTDDGGMLMMIIHRGEVKKRRNHFHQGGIWMLSHELPVPVRRRGVGSVKLATCQRSEMEMDDAIRFT